MDIKLKVIYDRANLYDLGITLVNQKSIDEKIAILNAVAEKKPNKRAIQKI